MNLNKQAATPIPLSPDEQYEASQLFGKSLFSALQMMREQQKAKEKLMSGGQPEGDGKVLKIPIPSSMMPQQKEAADSDTAYRQGNDPFEPEDNPGLLPHIKRNIGKYLGSYAGSMIGGGLGARRELLDNPKANIVRVMQRTGKKGIAGLLSGLAGGHMIDQASKAEYRQKLIQSQLEKQQLLQQLYGGGTPGAQEEYKVAEENESPEPGLLGRAFKAQQNPIKLLTGAQTGFSGAKKQYYMKQRARIEQELADAQKEYIDLLGKIKTGSANETPNVDAFCNGIAHYTLFGKKASDEEVDISDGSVKRLMGDVMSTAKKPFMPAVDTAVGGLLGTGTGAAYLTYLLRKSMRDEPEKYMQEHLPTRVELQPYS